MTTKNIKIGAVVFCLIFALGLNGLALWQYMSFLEVEKELSIEKESLYNLKEDIERTRDEIELYEEEKKEFQDYLFQERDVPAFLDEIAKLAKKDNINIVEMKSKRFMRVDVAARIAQSKSNQPIRNRRNDDKLTAAQRKELEINSILTLAAMPTVVQVKGTFNSIVRFLGDLQKYKQLVSIVDIEVANLRNYPELDCKFVIKIYSLTNLGELNKK